MSTIGSTAILASCVYADEHADGEHPADPDADASKAQQTSDSNNGSADKPKQEKDTSHAKKRKKGDKSNSQDQQQDGQHSDQAANRMPYGESAALGVMVASCPGDAVCVKETFAGSPADSIGLREGDYIVSLNNEKVTSPSQLRDVIEQMKPGSKVSLKYWREWEEFEQTVILATKSD